jgi:hypothetical protein
MKTKQRPIAIVILATSFLFHIGCTERQEQIKQAANKPALILDMPSVMLKHKKEGILNYYPNLSQAEKDSLAAFLKELPDTALSIIKGGLTFNPEWVHYIDSLRALENKQTE